MSDRPISKERLRWQCRRGMLELDVLLERYLSEHYDGSDAADRRRFADLLTSQDPQLQAWLLSGVEHPDPEYGPLVARIRSGASRTRDGLQQPDKGAEPHDEQR